MIATKNITLRRIGEQRPNISKNPLPECKGTVGAIISNEEFEEPTQYIVDEVEIAGITEKPFALENEPSEVRDVGEPFIIDLPPFEHIVFEFPEQLPIHNLQEVPWNYSKLTILIG